MDENKKYCVLIDSENLPLDKVGSIFQELSKYGDTPIRRIYGDFSNKKDEKWKAICRDHAITPIQTFNFTSGKNSVDMTLAIDGMEILYTKPHITGIVIASSDSDFTGLARKWREFGKHVIGMGEKKTPASLMQACSIFIYLEALTTNDESAENINGDIDKVSNELKDLVKKILVSNNGDMLISVLKEQILKTKNDFDERIYGYNNVPKFFREEFDFLEVYMEKQNVYRVRFKNESNTEEYKLILKKAVVDILSSSKSKMKMSALNNKLREQNLNYEDAGYNKFKKFLATIEEINIEGESVTLKNKK